MTKRSETVEEYLEAIYKLSRDDAEGGATVSLLAAALDVSPPSASQMLGRLRAAGLVEEGNGRGVVLTAQGAREAASLVRRHRLSERFLTEYLDVPWDEVHAEACRFEHAISPEVEARLAAQLGYPRTCPHGHVIPDEDGACVEEPLRPLAELEPGEGGTIARISDEQPELLRYLASLDLLPETSLVVENVAPFGGPLLVRLGDTQYALGREVAGKILVRQLPGERVARRGGPGHARGGRPKRARSRGRRQARRE
jgi:DtxR family transcriptional regulator, Mn-dependent transcriptional regulator